VQVEGDLIVTTETAMPQAAAAQIFTSEQEALRASARRFLEDRASSSTVRSLAESATGFDPDTWKQMADLGWTGIAIPEELGGAGLGFFELSVLLEEMGRVLLPSPFLASMVLGAGAILNAASQEQKERLLPGIARGELRATLAFVEQSGRWDAGAITTTASHQGDGYLLSGSKWYVVDGDAAQVLVVSARIGADDVGLFIVQPDAPGVSRHAMRTLDMTRKLAKIDFDNVGAELLGDADAGKDALTRTLLCAAVGLSAEMVGGAQRCLDMATDYAKTRIQFGRAIGSFQAIKHKCANMLTDVEMARSAAYYAAWAATEAADELPVAAAIAKAKCSDVFSGVAAENIQIHGGIGFTWEHDAHLYLRRAKSSEIYLGDSAYHCAHLADQLGV
jgi:alkylation response protein AidB-like acyl-CoA dehydrogenase